MKENTKWSISSAVLHIIAMTLMLCDHLWGTLLPAQEWLTCIGRMAFPIFAFMVVEGYTHTSNLKRYMDRMFIFAVIAEIPFDLMVGGTVFYPYHQNVIWTFWISLFFIKWIEKVKSKLSVSYPLEIGLVFIGFVVGFATMVDYYGVGILTVLMFYYLRDKSDKKKRWLVRICQVFCMYILNVEMMGGYCYDVSVFGWLIEIPQQAIAMFSLIPIWLYQGRQGIHNKAFQYFCYAFYPMHMLILVLIRTWILR